MNRWIIWGIGFLLGVALVGYSGYNLFVPEKITIEDEKGLLNEFAVKTIAEALRDRGARVAVYFVDTGDLDDFTKRLDDEGLLIDGQNRPDLIALYATFDLNFTAVYLGEYWYKNLTVSAEDLRINRLNQGLQNGEYSRAFVETLSFINAGVPDDMEITHDNKPYIVTMIAGLVVLLGLGWYARAEML